MPSLTNPLTFDWDADVPDDVRDQLLEKIVGIVRRWRLETPAILFLEMSAPLSHLGGQGLIAFAPFIAPVLPGGLPELQRLSKILEKPANVRLLIDRIAEEETVAARK